MTISKTYYFLIGLLLMICMLILGVVFFKERVAFCYTAYQAVFMIIEKKPWINWTRIGSVLPQFLPLAAIYMHASLRTVMILHSLSFLLFFLLMYLLAYYYSRSQMLFLVVPLYMLLIMTEVFYWPQSELQQGMLWLCLYAVLLFENKWNDLSQWQSFSIHFAFIIWVQFFHPILFFTILFLVIYYYDKRGSLFTPRAIIHMAFCCIAFVIRLVVGVLDVYEKGKLNIVKAIKKNLPHFFSLDSVHVFISKIHGEYLIYICVIIFAILWLLKRGQYIRGFAVFTFSLGYWILIMISSPLDQRFYTQNMLLPLGFIAALPIVVEIIPLYKSKFIAWLILVLLMVKMYMIYQAHSDYTDRYAIYDRYFDYCRTKNLNGVFVSDSLIDQKKAIITWGSGYESILISSLISPDSCRIIQIDPETIHYSFALDLDTNMVTKYGVWGQSSLPAEYFKLQHGKYEIINR